MAISRSCSIGLFVTPPKNDIHLSCDQVIHGKEGENVSFNFLQMDQNSIYLLIDSFTKTEVSKFGTLSLISSFTNQFENRFDDLVRIWEAVKYKVTAIKFDQNTIPTTFKEYVYQDLQKDSAIQIEAKNVTFSQCSVPCNVTSPFSPPPIHAK